MFLWKKKYIDNTLIKQPNIDNTLIKVSNTDYNEQSSIDNTEQSDTDNTEQSNIDNAFVTLPKWSKNLKCIINPLNTKGDNECFQYSVALSKYREKGSNYKKINKIKLFAQHFNFENIDHTLKKKSTKHLKKIMNQYL